MLCRAPLAQVATFLVLLAVAGCPQPKDPPVISSIEGSRSVEARDSVDYVCRATDLYPKELTYSWFHQGGRFAWDWGDSVRWYTPNSSGQSLIRVTVTDKDGLSASDSLIVTVRAETASVISWDAAVKAGHYQAWSDSLRARYELYGYCASDSGRLLLMVMDDSNFTKWVAGQPAVPLLLDTAPSKGHSFSIRVGPIGLYHIIIDNTQGEQDYNYWLYVWKAGP